MDMETAFRARLKAAAQITAVAGNRVHWVDRPQGETGPAIALQRYGADRNYTHDGASDLHIGSVQIDCWGDTYAQAKALEVAVIATIEPPATVSNVQFGQSFLTGNQDGEADDLPGGKKQFRRTLEFSIYWKE